MTIAQVVVMFLACGIGGLSAGGLVWKISMRPVDNFLCGVLGGGLGMNVLHAVQLHAATGMGRVDAIGLLGQIAAGAIGGFILLTLVVLLKGAPREPDPQPI